MKRYCRLSRPIWTCAMTSIHSRGTSPRLIPRSNRSMFAGTSANSGSSASLSNSRRATSASRRSTTTAERSAASRRASRTAAFSECGSTASAFSGSIFLGLPHIGLKLARQAGREKGKSVAFQRRRWLMRRPQAIGCKPAEAVLGAAARPVLGPNPAAIAKLIHRPEYGRIVHFTLVRLVARGHRAALQVADHREVVLEPVQQVTAHDLHVIEIELHAQVGPSHLGDDIGGVLDVIEEVVRPVARIDRLDQKRDVFLCRKVSGA